MEFGAPASAMVNIVKGDDGDEHDHDRDPAVFDQYYHDLMNLPPGFRFHPTDEEIVTHYLTPKVINPGFIASAIGQVDLNKSEPWDLPQKAKMGEKEWFFFCQRDRKYPTGMRTNRATESGYWKATGKDKEIYNKQRGGGLVGMKKTLVFYKGRAPKGEKTNWVMHEFRLEGKFSYYNFSNASKDEWVVCRVVHKNSTTTGTNNRRPIMSNTNDTNDYQEMKMMNSFVDGFLDSPSSLPPLVPADYHDKKFDIDKNEEVEIKGKFVREFTDGNGLNNNNNNRYDTTFQVPTYNYNFNTNAYTYQGGPVIKNQYPNGFQRGSSSGGGDRTPVEDFMERFKADQYFSSSRDNQSISYSQDTGLSTAHDMNNEISSSAMASDLKQEITSTDPLVRAPSLSDFDIFWEY